MEKVSRYVEDCNGDRPSRNLIEENVEGNRDYKRQAIDLLVLDGYLVETRGDRGARRYESARPFRDE
jgi:hypothetical protein